MNKLIKTCVVVCSLGIVGLSNLSYQKVEATSAVTLSREYHYSMWSFSERNAIWIEYKGYVGYIYKTYEMNKYGQHLFKGTLLKQRAEAPHYAPLKYEEADDNK
ncbi:MULTISPECIES: hypothetical protein [unclassified Granulicatella]|uniref:hypothetical protein n=1 Tax=unclassified Granulicatella TaxID=2630493 RepID=UPI0010730423|nr:MULTISPECIES: hypothetical protein [unclassified Granulicatella]MBF0780009.1 hypothetical protein [Granulicatella sp. 19428wC4_WM01]TFU95936.1 hypothetical protein E4T68_02770 [Granulicatella sp. WM01]